MKNKKLRICIGIATFFLTSIGVMFIKWCGGLDLTHRGLDLEMAISTSITLGILNAVVSQIVVATLEDI